MSKIVEQPEMTYTNLGIKDNVYIGKINGSKQYVQKRLALDFKRRARHTKQPRRWFLCSFQRGSIFQRILPFH